MTINTFEVTTPGYPYTFARFQRVPMDKSCIATMTAALSHEQAVPFQPGNPNLDVLYKIYSVRSIIVIEIKPIIGKSWMLRKCPIFISRF